MGNSWIWNPPLKKTHITSSNSGRVKWNLLFGGQKGRFHHWHAVAWAVIPTMGGRIPESAQTAEGGGVQEQRVNPPILQSRGVLHGLPKQLHMVLFGSGGYVRPQSRHSGYLGLSLETSNFFKEGLSYNQLASLNAIGRGWDQTGRRTWQWVSSGPLVVSQIFCPPHLY